MARVPFDFVPLPRQIWDAGLTLTAGEFHLCGYLLRHTEYGTEPRAFTDDELLHGRRRQDGSRMDGGCGIKGTNNLKEARRRLQERGWLALSEQVCGRSARVYDLSSLCRKVSETDSSTIQNGQFQLSETDTSSIHFGHFNCPNRTPEVSISDTQLSEMDTPIRNRPSLDLSQTGGRSDSLTESLSPAPAGQTATAPSERGTPEAREAQPDARATEGGCSAPAPPKLPKFAAIARLMLVGYCGDPNRRGKDGPWLAQVEERLRDYHAAGLPLTREWAESAVKHGRGRWRAENGGEGAPEWISCLLDGMADALEDWRRDEERRDRAAAEQRRRAEVLARAAKQDRQDAEERRAAEEQQAAARRKWEAAEKGGPGSEAWNAYYPERVRPLQARRWIQEHYHERYASQASVA